MNISDLRVGQGKVDLEATVIEKLAAREFDKFGKKGKVCEVRVKDASGSIKLTLWNEQVDAVSVGNKIKVINGYVSEFKGEKQLSTGKFGSLEVLDVTSKDLGEHILTQDEVEESKTLEEEFVEPPIEEEVTEDEMEESVILKPKKVEESAPKRTYYDDEDLESDFDVDEERVE
jgi:replication factor A1